jgi:hypothetical protein
MNALSLFDYIIFKNSISHSLTSVEIMYDTILKIFYQSSDKKKDDICYCISLANKFLIGLGDSYTVGGGKQFYPLVAGKLLNWPARHFYQMLLILL